MDNVFVLSSRPQLIDSLRRSLVYVSPMGLSFKFYEEMESLLAEISMSYMPKLILVDQNSQKFNLPSNLYPIVINLVERPSHNEREVYVFQSITGFIDDVIALCGAKSEKQLEYTHGPRMVWILDPNENYGREDILKTVMRFAKRNGISPVLSDFSKWGDVLTTSESFKAQGISELLERHSQGQLGDYLTVSGLPDLLTGVDHPMDLAYLTQSFMEELWAALENSDRHFFFYSGFLEASVMTYLTAHCDCIWLLECPQGNLQRRHKEEKLANWILSNNKKVRLEKIKINDNMDVFVESLFCKT